MTNIGFIGDIHGDMEALNHAVKSLNKVPVDHIFQVGDMGVGFVPEIPIYENLKFIRGNHDNLEECRKHPSWIKDGFYDENLNMFFVGGAASIDKNSRTPGYDWWPDEEVLPVEAEFILKKYLRLKPKIVVSHDFPESVIEKMFGYKKDIGSITSSLLDLMFLNHQPELWVGGHYHQTSIKIINSTKFVCVNTNCGFVYSTS